MFTKCAGKARIALLVLIAAACSLLLPTSGASAGSATAQVYGGLRNGIPQYRLPAGASPTPVRPAAHSFLADYSLDVNGLQRSYRLFVPRGLRGPAPFVVAMTGWTLTGDADAFMHWRQLAVTKHFVVLEPRGYGASWNAGTCCGAAVRDHVDDDAALRRMIESASHAYPLNRHRLYLVGFSNGGMMALDYACRNGSQVAGVGVVASAYVSRCTPARAVPVMHIHGLADGVLPVRGGWSQLLARDVPSMTWTDSRFAALDAAAGTPVRSVRLQGVDHVWPRLGWQGNYPSTSRLFGYLWSHQR